MTQEINMSSTVWKEDGRWHAQITIAIHRRCTLKILHTFELEREAEKWRASITPLLEATNVEIEVKS